MRNLLVLILIMIALAVVRWLVTDVARAVKKAVGSDNDSGRSAGARREPPRAKSGHLVRDPVSGTFIDEQVAIQAEINGQTFFFESDSNRDEYVKRARAGQA